jgi:polyhydroxyalkanoate synthase
MQSSEQSKFKDENLSPDYMAEFLNQNLSRFDCWTEMVKSNLEQYLDHKSNPTNMLNPEFMQKIIEDFLENPTLWNCDYNNFTARLEDLFEHIMDHVAGKPSPPIITESQNDKRFKDEEWANNPVFSYIKQSYLLQCKHFQELINKTNLDDETKKKAAFIVKNITDAIAPTNFPFTNPQVIREFLKSKGENFVKGYQNFIQDQTSHNQINYPSLVPKDAFKVGYNIATTPGEVVYENEIFQLIQFRPQKTFSWETPLLIVPPWINKYYIFDLRKENSFVSWNLKAGRTVFIISWVNPDPSYADLSFSDYVLKGVHKGIQEVQKITKCNQINTLGFCVGGVALMTLIAYLSHKKINNIKSATFLATPVNFKHLKELSLFVSDEYITHLEKHLKKYGILAGDAMVRMFSSLRANDLIWSNYINNYLLGKDPAPLDFLFWNNDTTHLPARMHLEYLKEYFIGNLLMKKGGILIDDVPIDIGKIEIPTFIMAAKSDHIVPWASSYAALNKIKNTKFVLSASGHVAGVINHPDQEKYCYWTNSKSYEQHEKWLQKAKEHKGSWWIEWDKWIKQHQGVKKKSIQVDENSIIEHAPGRYATQVAPRI